MWGILLAIGIVAVFYFSARAMLRELEEEQFGKEEKGEQE